MRFRKEKKLRKRTQVWISKPKLSTRDLESKTKEMHPMQSLTKKTWAHHRLGFKALTC